MNPTGTCLTCTHFRVIETNDAPLVACTQQQFSLEAQGRTLSSAVGRAAHLTGEAEAEVRNELLYKLSTSNFDYKPPTCTTYEYGENSLMSCKTCAYSQSMRARQIGDNVLDELTVLVGCEVYDSVDRELLAAFPHRYKAYSRTATGCPSFTRVGEYAPELPVAGLHRFQERGTITTASPDDVALAPLLARYYAAAKWLYKKSSRVIYSRMLKTMQSEQTLDEPTLRLLRKAYKHRSQFEFFTEHQLRLEKLITPPKDKRRRFIEFPKAVEYHKHLCKFGYLTPLQESRMRAMEERLNDRRTVS